jgi:hypothetical protein
MTRLVPLALSVVFSVVHSACASDRTPPPKPPSLPLDADPAAWSEGSAVRPKEAQETKPSPPAAPPKDPLPTAVARPPETLPPEEIQRIVRAEFGRFRKCYDDGLARTATLAGRIVVRFVIAADGHVTNVVDADDAPPLPGRVDPPSSVPRIPDKQVQACVVAGFSQLIFPKREKGSTTVTYPFVFTPATP